MAEHGNVESEDSELAAFLDEGLFGEQQQTLDISIAPANDKARQLSGANGVEQQTQQAAEPLDGHGSELRTKRQRIDAERDSAAQQICPPHPGFCFGMCIRCGAPKPAPDAATAVTTSSAAQQPAPGLAMTRIKHLHHNHEKVALEVSADEAARIATDGVKKLRASRRLVLVLDLDHTLLNTVRDTDLQGAEREAALEILKQQQDEWQQYMQQQEQRQSQQQGQQGQREQDKQPSCDLQQEQQLEDKQLNPEQQQQQQEQDRQQDDTAAATAPVTAAEAAEGNAEGIADQPQPQPQQQLAKPPRPRLYHLADKGLWTKLRPGVEKFLAAVAPLYELHIYTMGDKGYAGLMADLLDPEHKLFVGRVVSAADSTRAGVKDLDVLLADESLVLILDDTEHVWENHKANLIQVERYHFFGASARLFHPLAHSPLESGSDECEQGGMLDKAAQLLTRLHARVYGPAANQQQQQQQEHPVNAPSAFDQAAAEVQDDQQQQQQQQQQQNPGRRVVRRHKGSDNQQQQQQGSSGSSSSRPGTPAAASVLVSDVRECLEAESRSILAGCCIVFSRCWPNTGHDPVDHPLWQLVVRMGGQCSLHFKAGVTTHMVVAPDKSDPGQIPLTDKVRAAQQAGVPVVHPDWLLACKFSWCRQPEQQYALPQYTGGAVGAASSSRLLGPPPRHANAAEQERQAVMRGAGRTS